MVCAENACSVDMDKVFIKQEVANSTDTEGSPENTETENNNNNIIIANLEGLDCSVMKVDEPPRPFLLPHYIKHEFNPGDNMVKLKGRHILKNVIETDQPIDTILCLKDGKIGAHRIILAAVSPFLESILADQETRVATVILPDISKKTMETLLNIAYTGKLIYLGNEADEVFSSMEALRFCEDAELTVQQIFRKVEPEPEARQISSPLKADCLSECCPQTGKPKKRRLSSPISSISPSTTRMSKRRKQDSSNDFDRFRLKDESFTKADKDKIPPYFDGFNAKTEKVRFNMFRVPRVSVPIVEMPENMVNIYMAKLEAENMKISTAAHSGGSDFDLPNPNQNIPNPNPPNISKSEEPKVNLNYEDVPPDPVPEIRPEKNVEVTITTTAMPDHEVPQTQICNGKNSIHNLCDQINDIQMECCG